MLIEYIEGRLVSDIWSTLDVQHGIHSQPRTYIKQLRSIRMNSRGTVGGIYPAAPSSGCDAGRFKSNNDIESCLNERLLVCHEFDRLPLMQPSFSGSFDLLVMCHMDIAARNLILDDQVKV